MRGRRGEKKVGIFFSLKLRRELAQRANLLSVEEEQDRNRDHRDGDKAQHARRPVHAEIVIHLHSEEGEATTNATPDERVGGNGGVCEHEVYVDDVVEALHEDDEDAASDGHAGENLWEPVDVRAGCPSEPEQTGGEDDGGDHHGDETFFGDDAAVFLEFARETGLGDDGD